MLDLRGKIGLALSQIIATEVPVNPRFRILLDFEFFKMGSHKMLFANLLTAAYLLLAKMWKLEDG